MFLYDLGRIVSKRSECLFISFKVKTDTIAAPFFALIYIIKTGIASIISHLLVFLHVDLQTHGVLLQPEDGKIMGCPFSARQK